MVHSPLMYQLLKARFTLLWMLRGACFRAERRLGRSLQSTEGGSAIFRGFSEMAGVCL